eukprot:7673741-Pyramimonas_sp.AAC.1
MRVDRVYRGRLPRLVMAISSSHGLEPPSSWGHPQNIRPAFRPLLATEPSLARRPFNAERAQGAALLMWGREDTQANASELYNR